MCKVEYGMDDDALLDETNFWRDYVKDHIPLAYAGIRDIMLRHKAEG